MIKKLISRTLRHRRHLVNLLSILVSRLFAIAAYATSVRIFINHASAADYGVIAIAFSVLGLTLLLDVGIGYVLTQGVGRKLARTGKSNVRLFNCLFWAYTATAVCISACAVISFIILSVGKNNSASIYVWLMLSFPLLAISGSAAAVLQAHNHLFFINISRLGFEFAKAFSLFVNPAVESGARA